MLESILKTLKTQTSQIHKGQYPKEILQDLGKVGLYANVNNLDDGLYKAIEGVIEVSKICGNTGFCVWCQDILVWYLKHSKLEKTLLEKAIKGDILGGTGLSNPIKSFAKIESIKLKAQKVQGGFILNGILPYVSNIDYGHYFGVIAAIKDESMDSNFVMGLILCEKKRGIKLKEQLHFCALEGSATKSVIFKDYFLEESMILSNPASSLLPAILPGFVLLQAGIGLGLIKNALEMIGTQQNSKGGINAYLPYQHLKEEYKKLLKTTKILSKTPYGNNKTPQNVKEIDKDFFFCVLSLKVDIANLALESAKTCMLTYGTKGYLQNSQAQKLLLESYFVAMVTPSLKHIAKIMQNL